MATTKAVETPAAFVVLDTFVVATYAGPEVYAKGQIIGPDDPALKLWPTKFGPIQFSEHTPRRRPKAAQIATPELRAE